MTSTGFTKTTAQLVPMGVAYETLASGAVEKLNQLAQQNPDGTFTNLYRQFGSGLDYTPVDLTRVEPKPIKVQMQEGTVEVTAAVLDFSTIVTAVANSEGENFPAHGIFHVNADADGVGSGIAYTTDGTDPANSATAVELEVSAGQSFQLDTHEELIGLRMIALNSQGDPDAAATSVDVSYELNNISPDKDDV